jgi:predicted NAD/FAD-dependent oxidoreductase
MTDLSVFENDRIAYIEHAQKFWTVLKEHGARKANFETKKGDVIIKRWIDNKCIAELLTPLLEHEAESVRYAAAADLLNQIYSEKAVNVLEDIVENSQSFVGSAAKLFLMEFENKKKKE